jgi:2-polyprenyl-6-methoxyphenol hydroxylase-like FAD-dependent oxidoreductase
MPPAPGALHTTCCIVGGGPAGMMLGYLLARDGHDVTVLEKHKDFFRDFRGDTIHPSTLELMYELGLLDAFLALPHQEVTGLSVSIGGQSIQMADFTHLPTKAKFIALMPQWDFLNFLASQSAQYPGFQCLLEHEATDLIYDDNKRVAGVHVTTPNGSTEIHSSLVVACDGRHSTIRSTAGLPVHETGAPIDVLWFRLSRRPDDISNALGNINYGQFFLVINRGDYFQCGFIIAKDTYTTQIQPGGIPAFRESLVRLAPFVADRVDEITSWDQIKLLSVRVNHLTRWHLLGLLCIGDAAHAMSPVGGIGINLAIQDAVASARILSPVLSTSVVTELTLARIQHRREFPTRVYQTFQVFAHSLLTRVLGDPRPVKPPRLLLWLSKYPLFRRTMARFIGIGVRPEHIQPHEPASLTP